MKKLISLKTQEDDIPPETGFDMVYNILSDHPMKECRALMDNMKETLLHKDTIEVSLNNNNIAPVYQERIQSAKK